MVSCSIHKQSVFLGRLCQNSVISCILLKQRNKEIGHQTAYRIAIMCLFCLEGKLPESCLRVAVVKNLGAEGKAERLDRLSESVF